jgi:hypothetical protein
LALSDQRAQRCRFGDRQVDLDERVVANTIMRSPGLALMKPIVGCRALLRTRSPVCTRPAVPREQISLV